MDKNKNGFDNLDDNSILTDEALDNVAGGSGKTEGANGHCPICDCKRVVTDLGKQWFTPSGESRSVPGKLFQCETCKTRFLYARGMYYTTSFEPIKARTFLDC